MSITNNVTVSYSPTDYFYINANDLMPTDELCSDQTTDFIMIPDASCVSFPTPSEGFLREVSNCKDSNNIVECLTTYDKNNNTTYAADYPTWKQWQDLSMNCYKKELCKNKVPRFSHTMIARKQIVKIIN